MFVVEDLKLNKFASVSVPSPKDYFAKFGRSLMPAGSYTGDSLAPQPMTKVDSLAQAERMNDYYLHQESLPKEEPVAPTSEVVETPSNV